MYQLSEVDLWPRREIGIRFGDAERDTTTIAACLRVSAKLSGIDATSRGRRHLGGISGASAITVSNEGPQILTGYGARQEELLPSTLLPDISSRGPSHVKEMHDTLLAISLAVRGSEIYPVVLWRCPSLSTEHSPRQGHLA